MEKLLTVDIDEWRAEVPSIREHFAMFGDKLPTAAGRRGRRAGAEARLRLVPTQSEPESIARGHVPARARRAVGGTR